MSDPIERMNRLRFDVEGGPMLPAAEVRRRGDQLRRRRTVALTAGVALAVVAIVTPVAFLTGGDPSGDSPLDPVDTPSETSTSAPAPAGAVSEENLLRDEDVAGAWGDGLVVTAGDTTTGAAAVAPCSRGLAELGPTQVLTRTFGFTAVDGGDGDADHHASETVASFPDAAAAQQARDRVKSWIDDCAPSGAERYTAGTWTSIAIPVPGEAELGGGSYGPADAEPGSAYDVSGRDDLGWVLTSGVVVSGNRIAVITDLDLVSGAGGDTGAAVRSILPAAAERLVLDGEDEPSASDSTDLPEALQSDPIDREPPAPGSSETTIPDGFPLTAGMPTRSEPDLPGLEGPSRALPPLQDHACGQTREAAARTDMLNARYTDVTEGRARQLAVYESADAAWAELGDILTFYSACPVEADEIAPNQGLVRSVKRLDTAGEESWAVISLDTFDDSPGIHLNVTVLVRTGNAILTVDLANEGGNQGVRLMERIDELISPASETIAALCRYSADGC